MEIDFVTFDDFVFNEIKAPDETEYYDAILVK